MAAGFDLKERLGAGNFGEVWRVIDTGLNAERALKLIPPAKVLNPSNFFHEAQILKAAEHPNVIKVEETGMFICGEEVSMTKPEARILNSLERRD